MPSFFYTSVGPELFNKKFEEAFQFNYPDLVKNRNGELGREQFRRLLQATLAPLARTLLGCVLIIVVYAFLAKFIGEGRWVQAIQVMLMLAIGAGMVKSSMALAMFLGDLYRGKVLMAEGRLEPSWDVGGQKAVNHHETGSRTIQNHRFAIGALRFHVSESAFRILTDNFEAGLPTVRLYYTPASKKILSIEVVSLEELVLRPEDMKKKLKNQPPPSIWKSKMQAD